MPLTAHYGPFARSPCHSERPRFRPRSRRAEKQPFVFSAGRLWDEAKNIAALWPKRRGPAVAGLRRGGYGASEWGKRQSPPTVRLLGCLPPHEIADWLARAAIYALPARYEPFGLSALEAGLSGCALVLGDIPSLREVWGDAALFVPPDDADALHDALCRLIEDADCGGKWRARACARARAYTPERMAAGYLAAYRSLLQEKSACA